MFFIFPSIIAQKNIPKNKNGKKLRKSELVCVTNPLPFLSFVEIAMQARNVQTEENIRCCILKRKLS